MNIQVSASCAENEIKAFEDAWLPFVQNQASWPQFLLIFASVGYSIENLSQVLSQLPAEIQILGSTSCLGIMTQQGFLSAPTGNLGLLGLYDSEGNFGVGFAAFKSSVRQAAQAALESAILAAERSGEVPDLIWVSASPGVEEEVIKGITECVGPLVPIVGGSAADDTVSGNWRIFSRGLVLEQGLGVAVFYSSARILFAFHSGYEPSGERAWVTEARDRILYSLNGKPAAEVYQNWIGRKLSLDAPSQESNILAQTSLFPLGRFVGKLGSIPYFQLSHPEKLLPGGALTLFSDIHQGDEVWLMRGTSDSLCLRAGNAASLALSTLDKFSLKQIRGAVIIYCAGCMLSIQDRMAEVIASLESVLGKIPFLGAFTFGEQGCFPGGENRHGNLMISVVVFYEPE
ncbi:hypothetical protein COW36_14995 [bacterium (Candidatus Blackallbacteria) CG17_big_fil_post_rev_8_21_14_2_50_48_46]|uniref:Histidine kinase n=1 Tax=bacterium (Candidatus Blackallbacteria) CG17_big_fil_post_rev_8_21_14_2_50_48_46 TaxID=2014261 RepID=A0A2M7G2J6_9BACT|nr:MAG: hypothetical protein COW64_11555 [bacterium (Candidatus Blackallbacteria) CG18_big_fil_WC_8_21_14_2_50_49_26]PIW16016.1 MAG: hypothetical protein COW36_14995 [bacterium (Candidatus Blackallbacteria) CG17_big_fil_post_rev_8_21_14_2_50_48_46]PIW50428.1 MAG: hypothetical protein COW20_02710 [bacterium (Candidatus Blackallbacteria) CG13_big_fil_rev_8_21_14_2_50_49_14]